MECSSTWEESTELEIKHVPHQEKKSNQQFLEFGIDVLGSVREWSRDLQG